jgi:hypothetical protein
MTTASPVLQMPEYLLAKDLILQIIGEITVPGATYKVRSGRRRAARRCGAPTPARRAAAGAWPPAVGPGAGRLGKPLCASLAPPNPCPPTPPYVIPPGDGVWRQRGRGHEHGRAHDDL